MQLYVSKTLAPLNWLEITGDGPFWLVLTLYDTTLFSGVGSNDDDAALDHPRGLLMVRTAALRCSPACCSALLIHLVVILTLPAPRQQQRVGSGSRRSGQINKTVLLADVTRRRAQSAAARPGPHLCRLPARPRSGPARSAARCRSPSGRSRSTTRPER